MTSSTEKLSAIFAENPCKDALVSGGSRWTYAALDTAARRRVGEWRRRGAVAGDRILLLPHDRAECLIAILAASLGGFELVSPTQRASADEINAVRARTSPKLEWPSDDTVALEHAPVADVDGGFGNVRVVFFTSGSTGEPKGVCHDLESLLANAAAFNRRALVSSDVRMLHVMPAGYMAGVLNTFLSPLMAGGTVILGEAFSARSALRFWKVAREASVNAMWLSPSMVAALTQLCRDRETPAWARADLRHVFVGTAPLHPATRRAFVERLGVDCLESYGMTECMFASVNSPDLPNPRDTVGLLLEGVEAQARDGDGKPLEPGAEGHLWIRSRYTTPGYLDGGSGNVVACVGSDGWLDTGDIGVVDSSGRLTITGRLKDLIIRGGVNVSPKAVEDAILAFPGIRDAAVVGSPHPFWGEEVVAYVILSAPDAADLSAVAKHCSRLLPVDAVPSRVVALVDFPRSANGKVQKHLLRRLQQGGEQTIPHLEKGL